MSQIIADGFRNVEKIVQINQEANQFLRNDVEMLLSKAYEAEKHLSQLNHGAQGFIDAYNNATSQLSSLSMDPLSP
jgi:hypothetical protein